MINAILNGVLSFIINGINIILLPIDLAIDQYLPSLDTGLSYITDFFEFIGGIIPWIMSWFNMPTWFLQLVFGYMCIRLLSFMVVDSLKTILAWFQALKL